MGDVARVGPFLWVAGGRREVVQAFGWEGEFRAESDARLGRCSELGGMKRWFLAVVGVVALGACDSNSGGTSTYETGQTNPDSTKTARENQPGTNPEAQRNATGQ
jgi:hypothetical protein